MNRRPDIEPSGFDDPGCSAGEVFALRVHGQSMCPEFEDGDIIIIEPEGLARDGSYVLARVDEAWIFRQLVRHPEGWQLRALNPAWASQPLPGLEAIRGVVVQKAVPGRRRASRRYV